MGSVEGGSLLPVTELEVDATLLSLSWIPSSARLAAVGTNTAGDGVLKVYSLTGRSLKETGSATAGRPLRCGTFDVCDISERTLCCGDFSGNLSLWDVETLTETQTAKAHTDVLNSIAGGGVGSAQILTGGRDGEVKLWDRRTLDSPVVRMFPETGETRRDCWTVAHSGLESRLVAAGFDNGDIKLFDVRAMKLVWETTVSRAVTNLTFTADQATDWLLAGTNLGKLFKWDAKSPANTIHCQLDKSTVWGTESIGDGSVVVSCLGSGGLSVCRSTSDSIKQVCSHQVSEPPLNALSASRDKPGLIATASFDKLLRLFLYTGLK